MTGPYIRAEKTNEMPFKYRAGSIILYEMRPNVQNVYTWIQNGFVLKEECSSENMFSETS